MTFSKNWTKGDAIMTSYAFSASDIWVFYLHVILTSERRGINFFVDSGFRIQKYTPYTKFEQNQALSWKICKFLHFSVLRHIHNKRLPWQHLRLIRIVVMYKIKLEKFHFDILCRFGVIKESLSEGGGGAESPPRWDRVKVSFQSRRSEFRVFSIIHLNGHNFLMNWTDFKKMKFCRQHR